MGQLADGARLAVEIVHGTVGIFPGKALEQARREFVVAQFGSQGTEAQHLRKGLIRQILHTPAIRKRRQAKACRHGQVAVAERMFEVQIKGSDCRLGERPALGDRVEFLEVGIELGSGQFLLRLLFDGGIQLPAVVLESFLQEGPGPLPGMGDPRTGAFFQANGKGFVPSFLQDPVEFRLGLGRVLSLVRCKPYAHPFRMHIHGHRHHRPFMAGFVRGRGYKGLQSLGPERLARAFIQDRAEHLLIGTVSQHVGQDRGP